MEYYDCSLKTIVCFVHELEIEQVKLPSNINHSETTIRKRIIQV